MVQIFKLKLLIFLYYLFFNYFIEKNLCFYIKNNSPCDSCKRFEYDVLDSRGNSVAKI